MSDRPSRTHLYNLRLGDAERRELEKLAELLRTSMAGAVRYAVSRALRRELKAAAEMRSFGTRMETPQ